MAILRPARELISLTAAEVQLFDALQSTIQAGGLRTQLRVTGGWVRDKILGLASDDIDIALDDMMGEPFAKLVVEHLGMSKHVGTIKANPLASKHLETACLHLMGFQLDLVNLRCEEYSDTSRIPQIKIGTPEEDAFRRDLTINSMFYNITQDVIEDLTGLGLVDLERRIARTPLHPLQTFLDDPLRILRIIRFATRFDLTIIPEIGEAAQDERVKDSLKNKVSRERIYKELSLMLKGRNPLRALELIQSYGLVSIIFKPSDLALSTVVEQNFPLVFKLIPLTGEPAFLLYTAAALSCFQDAEAYNTMKKKQRVPEYDWICSEALKLSNAEIKDVSYILKFIPLAVELTKFFDALKASTILKALKEHWELPFILAAVKVSEECNTDASQEFDKLRNQVIGSDLIGVWDDRPLLNGNELRLLLNIDGRSIGTAINRVLEWQVLNRRASPEDLRAYIGGHPEEFTN